METKSFFGENGLTSTSANHYANLAREQARANINFLSNLQFYTESISVIGDTAGGVIREGATTASLPEIKAKVQQLGELNALIAFFNEAIKEKERLSKVAADWQDEQMRDEFNRRHNELAERKPRRANYLTEDDVKNAWTVGEQEKYLTLQAQAAAIGKLIHEDGALSRARIDLMQKISAPRSVDVNGRDTIIHSYAPTVEQSEVDGLYFDLQSQHRSLQAELNGIKKKIQDSLEANKIEADAAYRAELVKWNDEVRALDRELSEAYEDERAERMRRQQYAAALKIVVPNRLKAIFESLK